MGVRKALLVGGLVGLLAGSAIAGSFSDYTTAVSQGLVSPKHHFTQSEERFGYTSLKEKAPKIDYVSEFNLAQPREAQPYNSDLWNNENLHSIVQRWVKQRFDNNPTQTKTSRVSVYVDSLRKLRQRGAPLSADERSKMEPWPAHNRQHVQYKIFVTRDTFFRNATDIIHEYGHVACRNPYPFYDEMGALLTEYVAMNDIAGNNPRLKKIADKYFNGRRNEQTRYGSIWREAERLMKRYNTSKVNAAVRLFNDINNHSKFKEISKINFLNSNCR